jgi:hypothetical protein
MSDYVIWNGETWETWDLTRTCSMFFITPNNELFMIDTSGCYDYEMTGPEELHYDHDHLWKNWNTIPNGTHGKVKPFFLTGCINLVPRYVGDRPNTRQICLANGLVQG